jgi:hypothetical protein
MITEGWGRRHSRPVLARTDVEAIAAQSMPPGSAAWSGSVFSTLKHLESTVEARSRTGPSPPMREAQQKPSIEDVRCGRLIPRRGPAH